MQNASNIHEHMEVLGKDGMHVGTVDHMEGGDRIKLTRNDPAANGQHHFIPLAWVERVDGRVHLNCSSRDAMTRWQT